MTKRRHLDLETGEIIEGIVSWVTEEQDKEIKRIYKAKKDNKLFLEQYGSFIFKENSDKSSKLENGLTDSDIIRTLYLSTYLDYDSNLKYDNGKKMHKGDVFQVAGVNKNIFYEWYNKLLANGIIYETSRGVTMNTDYYIKGKLKKNTEYNRIFIKGLRELYESNIGANQKTLGLVIRLLSYVNTYSNVLCWHPKIKDEKEAKYITVGELCEELGMEIRNASKLVRAISKIRVFDGQPLVIFFSDNEHLKDNYLMFHPYISYSGKNSDIEDVYKMFLILKERENLPNRKKNKKSLEKLI